MGSYWRPTAPAASRVGPPLAASRYRTNVDFNAHKMFNLHKGLPIGALMYGLGNIGADSISTLSKELRRRFQGEDPDHLDWKLDPAAYQLADVAEKARIFLYDEHYRAIFGATATGEAVMGYVVAGYSSGPGAADEYSLVLDGGSRPAPALVRPPARAGSRRERRSERNVAPPRSVPSG